MIASLFVKRPDVIDKTLLLCYVNRNKLIVYSETRHLVSFLIFLN
jgi:hypothetical protein